MIQAETVSGPKSATRGRARPPVEIDGELNPRLVSFIERIERLHEERKALSDDISSVYDEAKGEGFDPKIMREVVKIRGQDPDKLSEHETLLDLYLRAVGSTR